MQKRLNKTLRHPTNVHQLEKKLKQPKSYNRILIQKEGTKILNNTA